MPTLDTGKKITPVLMYEGEAEDAMEFYVSLFDSSGIVDISRYGPDEAGAEGTVEQATFTVAGESFMVMDSSEEHEFSFTPSISFFVQCDSEDEIDKLYKKLSENGEAPMPLNSYPFSEKFGWVEDQFGVSWQLNLG